MLAVWKRDRLNRRLGIECPACRRLLVVTEPVLTGVEDGAIAIAVSAAPIASRSLTSTWPCSAATSGRRPDRTTASGHDRRRSARQPGRPADTRLAPRRRAPRARRRAAAARWCTGICLADVPLRGLPYPRGAMLRLIILLATLVIATIGLLVGVVVTLGVAWMAVAVPILLLLGAAAAVAGVWRRVRARRIDKLSD